jgi:hypothetical protein
MAEAMSNIDLPGSDIFHFPLDKPVGILDLREWQCSDACWQNKIVSMDVRNAKHNTRAKEIVG